MTSDLIAFLNARLDEDEVAANAATDSSHRNKCAEWVAVRDGNGYAIGDETGHFAFCLVGGAAYERHVVRHDPARVLREVAAKRAIIARYEDCLARQQDRDYSTTQAIEQAREYEDFVLPNLAAIYGDQSDYRQERG